MASAHVGWSDNDLLQTARRYVGTGYNQDAPEFAQFCHSAAKVIQKRRALHLTSLQSAPVIFVLAPVPAAAKSVNVCPMFDWGRDELAGSVWFGAGRLATASSTPLPEGNVSVSVEHVVNTLGAGSAPCIYYEAGHDDTIMRVYPQGFSSLDHCFDLSLVASNLNLDHLKVLMDKLHEEFLKTPSSCESARELWQDKGKWHPIHESEKAIQKILFIALKTGLGFGALTVAQEGSGATGRYDFKVKEQDPIDSSKWTYHAILELKVVKSFTYTGSAISDLANQDTVTSGVDQAKAYRATHSARMAAVCCYDMRKKPDPATAVAHETLRAQTEDMGLWAWPIYNSAKAARSPKPKLRRKRKSFNP